MKSLQHDSESNEDNCQQSIFTICEFQWGFSGPSVGDMHSGREKELGGQGVRICSEQRTYSYVKTHFWIQVITTNVIVSIQRETRCLMPEQVKCQKRTGRY